MGDIKLGKGYIKAACDNLGVSRSVYDSAVAKKKKGNPLSKLQLDVLAEYAGLIRDARLKLASIAE